MKVIVVGAGEVGFYLSDILSQMHFDITVIDQNRDQIQRVDEELDVKVLEGNGSSASMLKSAGVEHSDYVISVTSDDTTNIISCSAPIRITSFSNHSLSNIYSMASTSLSKDLTKRCNLLFFSTEVTFCSPI